MSNKERDIVVAIAKQRAVGVTKLTKKYRDGNCFCTVGLLCQIQAERIGAVFDEQQEYLLSGNYISRFTILEPLGLDSDTELWRQITKLNDETDLSISEILDKVFPEVACDKT